MATFEEEIARFKEMDFKPGYYWATGPKGDRSLVAFVTNGSEGRFWTMTNWGTDLSFTDIVGPVKPPAWPSKGPGAVVQPGAYYWARDYTDKIIVVVADHRRRLRILGGGGVGDQTCFKLISKAISESDPYGRQGRPRSLQQSAVAAP